MRRAEREIVDENAIRAILLREQVVRVAFAAGDEPYVVPLSYGYDEARHELCLHTASRGRKIEFIAANPHVCFEIEGKSDVRRADVACRWGLRYESLIGYGTLSEVVETKEKERALACLMRQQAGKETAAAWTFSPDEIQAVRVWRLAIESATGKRAP